MTYHRTFLFVLFSFLFCASLFATPVVESLRVFEDFAFPRQEETKKGEIPQNPSALSVALSLDFPAPIQSLTIHLKCGETCWYSVDTAKYKLDLTKPISLRIPLSSFAPEGTPAPIATATHIRVSAWMKNPCAGIITLTSAFFEAPASVAIVRATQNTAPNAVDFANQMSARAEALLSAARIPYDVISDDFSAKMLENRAVILLPHSPTLSTKDLAALHRFIKKGGRLVVFYNASATLASLMNMKVSPWEQALWPSAELDERFGGLRRFPYYTDSIIPAFPKNEKAKIIAWMVSTGGKRSTRPAIVQSSAGAWFSHIPPRAYPAAVDTIAAIVLEKPDLAKQKQPPLENLPPADGETIVGAWLAAPKPRMVNHWAEAAPKLRALGLNTLFVHVQASTSMLPVKGSTPEKNLAEAMEACKKANLQFHAWVTCFSLDSVPELTRRKYLSESRTLPDKPNWLNPALSKNHDIVIDSLVRLAKLGVPAIHLDYVRTPTSVLSSKKTADGITEFVRKASKAVRKVNPKIIFTAAVFPTPASGVVCNQDWEVWVKEGIIDYAVPMTYTTSPSTFHNMISACTANLPPEKIIAGIATGADEAQCNSGETDRQLEEAKNLRGVSFFCLDDSLLEILGEARQN